jgi:LmbE family N-acetylglucosaminyl deacetylase
LRLPAIKRRLVHDAAAPPVVLSPHFDDAVLDCFALLSAAAPVRVVNVFAAPPRQRCLTDWDHTCGATDSVEWTERRRAEDGEALALLGRASADLPFRQASVRELENERPPSLRALERAVALAVGSAGEVHAPAGIGGHADHELVRDLALRLARRGFPVRLHADLPYAVRGGWPSWIGGDGPSAADDDWRRFLRDVPGLEPERGHVIVLSEEQAEAKVRTLRLYRTQFEQLDGEERLLSRPGALAYEVSWRVGPEAAEEAPPSRR